MTQKNVVIAASKLGVLEQNIKQALDYKLKKDRRSAAIRAVRIMKDLKLDGAMEKVNYIGFVVRTDGEVFAVLLDHADENIIGEVGPTP